MLPTTTPATRQPTSTDSSSVPVPPPANPTRSQPTSTQLATAIHSPTLPTTSSTLLRKRPHTDGDKEQQRKRHGAHAQVGTEDGESVFISAYDPSAGITCASPDNIALNGMIAGLINLLSNIISGYPQGMYFGPFLLNVPLTFYIF